MGAGQFQFHLSSIMKGFPKAGKLNDLDQRTNRGVHRFIKDHITLLFNSEEFGLTFYVGSPSVRDEIVNKLKNHTISEYHIYKGRDKDLEGSYIDLTVHASAAQFVMDMHTLAARRKYNLDDKDSRLGYCSYLRSLEFDFLEMERLRASLKREQILMVEPKHPENRKSVKRADNRTVDKKDIAPMVFLKSSSLKKHPKKWGIPYRKGSGNQPDLWWLSDIMPYLQENFKNVDIARPREPDTPRKKKPS
jgi:hypothetical protein